ncbi:putative pyridoxine 5'-phosphate oxidase [Aurantimonas manganoxydans SI85-9A1]|uniref:Putative pyridoxine 5'-phosphate oxidase n=1 Tax=Aurantimonas manganoxydans (strain ATCC BAA-1229 / DSM 21871 / SI85-9A1) TaxID=287752 RepID=Q1YGQ6_AURMS|nr:pyridoxamine 5'-phosphate oxidase family protein [Aurantimonas manganoxydans]EAS49169.1 putative pyridoxine 5'-phosphate oxidase [Aurantimonas manganoxydans SI85-9A1]
MAYGFLDIAVTPTVRSAQEENGVAEMWQNFTGHREFDRFDESTKRFIEARDSFYLASVSETGWPYVQHRGGPPGFLKVVDERTLAFADYRGNRQYISRGNVAANDRVCLFLVDYPHRTRLKIYAHAQVVTLESDPALRAQVEDPDYRGRPERLFRLRLAAFDWNCAQHITPRFTGEQLAEVMEPLHARLAGLEAENAALRARHG